MEIIFLLIAWLLGLFSPLIADRIRRRFQKGELKQGLFNELKEISYRMVVTVSILARQYDRQNRELFKWVHKQCDEYSGTYPDKDEIKMIFDEFSKYSDEELSLMFKDIEDKLVGAGASFKKYSTPLLDSKIGTLTLFGVEFQTKIHEIRARIDLLNQEIDNVNYYFKGTFTITEPENFKRNSDNLKQGYRKVKNESYEIVNLINNLISKYSKEPSTPWYRFCNLLKSFQSP